jgi:7-carboxy-7-deazaguanine synthase
MTSKIQIPQYDFTKEMYGTECFHSIQGESRFAGCSTIFLRFAGGCFSEEGKYGLSTTKAIRCPWCDEVSGRASITERPAMRIERTPNKRDFYSIPNPVNLDTICQMLIDMGLEKTYCLSITGGEPLAFPDTIRELYNRVGHLAPFYLETNGIRPVELEEVIDCVKYVVPDIKLPSSVGNDYSDLHRRFLDICQKNRKHTTVKSVFTSKITDNDVEMLIDILKPYFKDPDFDIDFCLQPVTPFGPVGSKMVPSDELQWDILMRLGEAGIRARVLPQVHKLLGKI